MRRLFPVVGLLAGSLALAGAKTEADAASLVDTLRGVRSAPAGAAPASRSAPSLRSLNRSAGSARAYSPWLRANVPDREKPAVSEVRTMCVRTCDGYYWPMSDVADRADVLRDASACVSSCRAEARLFTLPRGSSDIAAMTDLSGRLYGNLETAFHYRKALKPGCGCQPAPWSGAAQMRHARYAEAEALKEARLKALVTVQPRPLDQILADLGPTRPALRAPALPILAPVNAALAEEVPAFDAPAEARAPARTAARMRARRQHFASSVDRKTGHRPPPARGLFAW